MDGASNNWIARKAVRVLNEIAPKYIVIHWSFFTRGENPNNNLRDEDRRLHHVEDISVSRQLEMFAACLKSIEQQKHSTHIIHSFIPNGPPVYYLQAEKKWNKFKGNDWPNWTSIVEFNDLSTHIKTELQNFDRYDIFRNSIEYRPTFETILDSVITIPELDQVDLARDGLHYDILTATNFVDQLATVISALPVH
jgi:hypothetical protein